MRVLVAVITCRRVQGLQRLLKALMKLELAVGSYDILVVDNACEAQAEATVREIAKTSPPSLQYLAEEVPGIVSARNRCVEAFLAGTWDALAFIDDDEWPATERWLSGLVAAMQAHCADIACGDVLSSAGQDVPAWALEVLYRPSGRREGEPVSIFYTGNVLLARRVLEQVRPAFDARFAMSGGSDYHFALKCLNAGFKAVHADAPVVEAFPRERATLSWFARRGFRSGVCYTRSHMYETGGLLTSLHCLRMAAGRAGLGILTCAKGLALLDKGEVVRGLFRFSSAVGTLAGFTNIGLEEYAVRHRNA